MPNLKKKINNFLHIVMNTVEILFGNGMLSVTFHLFDCNCAERTVATVMFV